MATGNQTTTYVYGTTLADSDVATSTLKRAEVYPDSVDSDDRITFTYNRQQQVTSVTDQNGTVHAYEYDQLGRQTQDRVTSLGTGVDGGVRRIATTYEVRGMRETVTSYDDATVGQGHVVNEVRFAYNDFGQLTADSQSHSGAVNLMNTPKVQYAYSDGSENTIRPTALTYPNGRVLTYDYGTSGGTDDVASRVASLIDDDVSATHLVDYSYLGRDTFVEVDYTEPDLKYTLVGTAGGNDPDTGDIYRGLDRFGRVKDSYWYNYGSATDVDRIQYGYDRAGNRLWRKNTVAAALGKSFDELYTYDGLHRLADMQRGTLNANRDAVTNLQFAECWQLDETGNWQNFRQDDDGDGDGAWDLEQSRTANPVNEIAGISETAGPAWATPVYSRAGNMTTIPQPADPTESFTATYDAWNRLVTLADAIGTVQENEYDGLRHRTVCKNYVSGSLNETRHFYYSNSWQTLEERLNSSADPNRQFIWSLRYVDDCVLRDRDTDGDGTLDERVYALQDANWNVTAATDTAGDVQERYAYQSYGQPLFLDPAFASQSASSLDWETLFASYRWEKHTGLYPVRARFLNMLLGTWLQRDAATYVDGFALYQYVASNPIVYTDSTGQELQVPNDSEQAYFIALLNQLCPEGRFTVGFWDDVQASEESFCGDWVKKCVPVSTGGWREGSFYEIGYLDSTHRVSCECVCDAINSDRTINLYRRSQPGGAASGGDLDDVTVGPGRPGGYPGRGATAPPAPGRVPAPSWIILGHELCGHAVPQLRHPQMGDPARYTNRDPVIEIENVIRKEHSCPRSCTHPDRVDWGERGPFLP